MRNATDDEEKRIHRGRFERGAILASPPRELKVTWGEVLAISDQLESVIYTARSCPRKLPQHLRPLHVESSMFCPLLFSGSFV